MEMAILSQSLELGIQGRNWRLVALEAAEGNKDRRFLKMSDLDAAGIVFEVHVTLHAIYVVESKGGMQTCGYMSIRLHVADGYRSLK